MGIYIRLLPAARNYLRGCYSSASSALCLSASSGARLGDWAGTPATATSAIKPNTVGHLAPVPNPRVVAAPSRLVPIIGKLTEARWHSLRRRPLIVWPDLEKVRQQERIAKSGLPIERWRSRVRRSGDLACRRRVHRRARWTTVRWARLLISSPPLARGWPLPSTRLMVDYTPF